VKFILATTDPQRLPVTILSRCLQFNLKPLTPPVIAAHLKHVLEVEAIPADEPALAQLAKAAAGSLRDSLSLLDQAIAHGGGKVTGADVAQMLGSLGADLVWPLLERVVEGDGAGTMREAGRIAERSMSLDGALSEIAAILHRIALAQAGAASLIEEEDSARVAAMAQHLDAAKVQVMYQIALLGRRDLHLAPDEFAGFTMALLRMLSFMDGALPARPARAAPAPATAKAEGRPERAAAAMPAIGSMPSIDASPPSVAAEPAAQRDGQAFDGNWPALVEQLGLTGMAGMVARHGEFASFENSHLVLVVPEAQKLYAERAYVEKLKAALAPRFGTALRITVRVGTIAGTTVAAAQERASAERQASAAAAIEEDPFVRDLVRDLGAEVVSTSIRPTEDPAAGKSSEKR